MEEEWRDIPGYSYYEVSNMGRIRSKDKYVKCRESSNSPYLKKGKILTPVLLEQGYYAVSLISDNGKNKKNMKIHRLVAITFIPNPLSLPIINHKDENRKNNIVNNLEWCTNKYNSNYSDTGKKAGMKIRNRQDTSKPICQYTLNMEFIQKYPSIMEACRNTGICRTTIVNCCRGYYKHYGKIINSNHAGGYIWRFKEN